MFTQYRPGGRATKSYRVRIVRHRRHMSFTISTPGLFCAWRPGREELWGTLEQDCLWLVPGKKKTCFWLVHSNFHERGWTCGVSGDSKTTVALRQSDWIPQFSNKIHLATYRKDLNVKNKNTTTPLPAKIIGREGKLSLIVILLHHTYPFLASLASGTSGTSFALQVARRLRLESDDHVTWRSRLQ